MQHGLDLHRARGVLRIVCDRAGDRSDGTPRSAQRGRGLLPGADRGIADPVRHPRWCLLRLTSESPPPCSVRNGVVSCADRAFGALLIASGAVLSCWTLPVSRRRFAVTIGIGHELATGGPFQAPAPSHLPVFDFCCAWHRAVAADRFHLRVIRHHRCPVGPACPIGGDPATAGLR